MTEGKARSAINMSALVVGGIYLYRRLVEPAVAPDAKSVRATAKQGPGQLAALAGASGAPAAAAPFVAGWGFVYLSLSVLAGMEPSVAGGLATLIMVGSVIVNGKSIAGDISKQTKNSGAAGAGKPGQSGGHPSQNGHGQLQPAPHIPTTRA